MYEAIQKSIVIASLSFSYLHLLKTYSSPPQCDQTLKWTPTTVCPMDRLQLPASSARFPHFARQTQMQRFLVQAACEPFFLHRLTSLKQDRKQGLSWWMAFLLAFQQLRHSAVLICHRFKVLLDWVHGQTWAAQQGLMSWHHLSLILIYTALKCIKA